jgi:hypothetical protein
LATVGSLAVFRMAPPRLAATLLSNVQLATVGRLVGATYIAPPSAAATLPVNVQSANRGSPTRMYTAPPRPLRPPATLASNVQARIRGLLPST